MSRRSAPPGAGVAFVLASYAPDTPAGMERATAALAEGLHRIGHRPIIITASTPRPPSPQMVELSSLTIAFPTDDQTLRDAITSAGGVIRAELAAILDDHEIDVVVYVDALWGLGRLMADHPAHTVLAAHVLGHTEDLLPALGTADRVVAPSPTVIHEAAARGIETEHWQVVPNALLYDQPPPTPEQAERRRQGGPLRVLARPAENKGVPDLLQALPAGLDRHVDVILAPAPFDAGPGVQQQVIARCQQYRRPNVSLSTRPLAWSQVPSWLAEAAVVIVPSRAETFGLVALEALGCGVPVVAYDIGNLPDLVGTRDDAGGVIVEHSAGPAELWRAALELTQDAVAYLHASRAAYYRSRDFRPTCIAERFMKAVW
ncbi:glycosyltransferase family 4 protein [Actinoallomurus sp. NBC_01490]|uniref:glycosyltransferase family 4 protein n=1 Tax=Actinoallomurus sp. NBC_01490 TaxID=2903557 RepID=UPI002E36B810|nr:glycosyltransferase family 4 protein [Actinoallomurus sp. NBC_01490]